MRASPVPWRPDLHVRLARRYAADQRATRAAAAASLASLAAWILGLDLSLHAATTLGAAAVAALVPVRPVLGRAFDWIGQRAGLAYQTYVEHDGRPDPYGFLSEARLQARLSVRGVPAPRPSAWWLPLAAAALGVWVLAAFVGGLGPRAGTTGGPGGGSPAGQTPPAITAEPQVDRGADQDGAEPPGDAAAEPGVDPREPAGVGSDAGADAVGEEGERQALERFLDNLRERPAEPAERAPPAEGEAGAPGVRDDAQPAAALQERREEDTGMAGALRADDDDQQRRPGLETGPPAPEGEEGEEGDEGGEGAGGEGGEEPGEEPGGEGEGEGDRADGDAEGPEEAAGRGPADREEEALDAGEGDAAGVGPGLPDDTEATELEPVGDPEALPGIVLPGEETPGGRVRLPGREEGFVPEGVPVERYERAVEQAITDGTVPVPYQEIIRNYFR